MDRKRSTRAFSRSGTCAAGMMFLFFLPSCKTLQKWVKPEPETQGVREPRLLPAGKGLVVSWRNPVDFRKVEIEIERPDGTRVPVPDGARGIGIAACVVPLEEVAPGEYKARFTTWVSQDPKGKSDPVTASCVIPEPIPPYIESSTLGRESEREPVNVLYLVHPESPMGRDGGSDKERKTLFRQVAANVLSVVFRHAIEVESGDVEAVEKQCEAVRGSLTENEEESWLFDPQVLAVIDYREKSGTVSGQLCLRLLDLEGVRAKGGVVSYDASGLYNERGLIAEGCQEVRRDGPRDAGEGSVREWTFAWRSLLREILENSRYELYKRVLQPPTKRSEKDREEDRKWLQVVLSGKVPDDLQPLEEKSPDEIRRRIAALEDQILFDRAEKPAPEETPPAEETVGSESGETTGSGEESAKERDGSRATTNPSGGSGEGEGTQPEVPAEGKSAPKAEEEGSAGVGPTAIDPASSRASGDGGESQ